MANLKVIRKRIASVKNTQQITRAMRMVAAAKLRKAQDRIVAARPYAEKMAEMVKNVAARAGENVEHPLLVEREVKNILLIQFTSDRGLCGAFNTNMIKQGQGFISEMQDVEDEKDRKDVTLVTVGRKGYDFFRKRNYVIREKYLNLGSGEDFDIARIIAADVIKAYTSGEFDQVMVLFSEFYSPMKQIPTLLQLLPVTTGVNKSEDAENAVDETGGIIQEYIFEPSAQELLKVLLPKFVEVQIYRAILDNLASEFGARMSAMENATNNADDMIKALTLKFNKARQEAITTELMDIVGGAEAQSK